MGYSPTRVAVEATRREVRRWDVRVVDTERLLREGGLTREVRSRLSGELKSHKKEQGAACRRYRLALAARNRPVEDDPE